MNPLESKQHLAYFADKTNAPEALWVYLLHKTVVRLSGLTADKPGDWSQTLDLFFVKRSGHWRRVWEQELGGVMNPYHNFGHLCDVASQTLAQPICSNKERGQQALAELYHDIYYNPKKTEKDNISRACEALLQDLKELPWLMPYFPGISGLIHKTSDHSANMGSDIIRHDLAIFSAPPQVYAQYEKAIREEYSFYSDKDFVMGRTKVLLSLRRSLQEHGLLTSPQNIEEAISNLAKLVPAPPKQDPTPKCKGKLLYAGSFDPFHKGHLYVVKQAVQAGYEVVVSILPHPSKKAMVPDEEVRLELAKHLVVTSIGRKAPVTFGSYSGKDTLGALSFFRCTGLLRGVRVDDPNSVTEEKTRAALIKSEIGFETILVPTSGHIATYSSSAAKTLVSLGYPARMLSTPTYLVYREAYYQSLGPVHAIRPCLLVGGIATGKTTYASKLRGYHIDLDKVAKDALDNHPDFQNESKEFRLKRFKSWGKYCSYMSRVRPIIMARLHLELENIRQAHDPSTLESTVYIQCNKIGLRWKDLLRLCGYNVLYMEDVSEDTCHKRILSRGSSLDTKMAVRKIESHAPSFSQLEREVWCVKDLVSWSHATFDKSLKVLEVKNA
jgi:cytidyltransferase-like protein